MAVKPLARQLQHAACILLGVAIMATQSSALDWSECNACTEGVQLLLDGTTIATCGNTVHSYASGVQQDYTEALKWFHCSAAQGDSKAQSNLGVMYVNGEGVEQNFAEALKWLQLAAGQGRDDALEALDRMQQQHRIPTLPQGTAVSTVLLASSADNAKKGTVVALPDGQSVEVGRVAVLLEGEARPGVFKLMNLQIN